MTDRLEDDADPITLLEAEFGSDSASCIACIDLHRISDEIRELLERVAANESRLLSYSGPVTTQFIVRTLCLAHEIDEVRTNLNHMLADIEHNQHPHIYL